MIMDSKTYEQQLKEISTKDLINELTTPSLRHTHYSPFQSVIREAIKRLEQSFALPEPMRDEPEDGSVYYLPNVQEGCVEEEVWRGCPLNIADLDSGLCHRTREDAQAWLDDWNRRVGRKA